ncbi:cation transporter dimerization domain-containing protein, partial [Burkholderia cenocepacia]
STGEPPPSTFNYAWDIARALDTTDTAEIRALLAATPGVRDVHDLRTRKMGDAALVDAHILVDPKISVSEGHYIAETARARVLTDARVLDALIHVDPENDAARRPALALPPRGEIVARLEAALAQRGLHAAAINLHYLSTGLEIDVTLACDPHETDAALAGRLGADALKREFGARRISFTRTMPAQA